MPVGIIGGGKHVVIHVVVREFFGIARVGAALGIGKVHRHQRLREDLARRSRPGLHQILDVEPDLFAAEGAVGLVAHLHHAHVRAGFLQHGQAVSGVLIHRLGLFLDLHVFPGQGDHLLARIGPEIRIMEVHDQLHAGLGGAFPDLGGLFDVVVAAAVSVAVLVIGVVPDAHADVGHARLRQRQEHVPLLAGEIIILHAALLLGDDRGSVHTQDEILRQIRDRLDIERIAGKRRLCGRARPGTAGTEDKKHGKGKDQTVHFLHRFPPHCMVSMDSYYYLIKNINQISRGSRGIFSAKALKIRLMQNLYAPNGAIKTFRNERFL